MHTVGIIGAGPTGLTLARTLHALKINSTEVLEQYPHVNASVSLSNQGLVLAPSTVDTLRRLDPPLYANLTQFGSIVNIFGSKTDKGDVTPSLPHQSGGHLPFLVIPRSQYTALALHTPINSPLADGVKAPADGVVNTNPVFDVRFGMSARGALKSPSESESVITVPWEPYQAIRNQIPFDFKQHKSEYNVLFCCDGLHGIGNALLRGMSTTGYHGTRPAPHSPVLIEGWLPISSTDSYPISNEQTYTITDGKGARFTAFRVPSGPVCVASDHFSQPYSPTRNNFQEHIYWRLLLPSATVAQADPSLKHLVCLSGPQHVSQGPVYCNTLPNGRTLTTDMASAAALPAPHLDTPYAHPGSASETVAALASSVSFPHHPFISQIITRTPPVDMSLQPVLELPPPSQPLSLPNAWVLGRGSQLCAPDAWLSDTNDIEDAVSMAIALYQTHPPEVTLSTTSIRAAFDLFRRARESRVRTSFDFSHSEADTFGDTSPIWKAISLFSQRYVPPSLLTDEYNANYANKPLNFFKTDLHIKKL